MPVSMAPRSFGTSLLQLRNLNSAALLESGRSRVRTNVWRARQTSASQIALFGWGGRIPELGRSVYDCTYTKM